MMTREAIISLMREKLGLAPGEMDALARLVESGEIRTLAAGESLIEEGQTGQALWFLLEGEVGILVGGREVKVTGEAGTILGEISAVSQMPATATVRAISDLSALRISHRDFHRALSGSEALAQSVLRSLAKYLEAG